MKDLETEYYSRNKIGRRVSVIHPENLHIG